jgi:hypothetical protein
MFGFMWAIISPFLSSKIRSRVNLLGSNTRPIFEQLPADVVAAEVGGGLHVDDAACALQLQQLQQQRDNHAHEHLF